MYSGFPYLSIRRRLLANPRIFFPGKIDLIDGKNLPSQAPDRSTLRISSTPIDCDTLVVSGYVRELPKIKRVRTIIFCQNTCSDTHNTFLGSLTKAESVIFTGQVSAWEYNRLPDKVPENYQIIMPEDQYARHQRDFKLPYVRTLDSESCNRISDYGLKLVEKEFQKNSTSLP